LTIARITSPASLASWSQKIAVCWLIHKSIAFLPQVGQKRLLHPKQTRSHRRREVPRGRARAAIEARWCAKQDTHLYR
jgi:hypothetical protein